jgi:hypothetical protein
MRQSTEYHAATGLHLAGTAAPKFVRGLRTGLRRIASGSHADAGAHIAGGGKARH